ncbi:MAG: alpha/beta fold hydrolase [Thermoanaerobaculia bacterium]
MKHGEAFVNGVRLHYVEEGSGPLVVLLHGFPDFWFSWRSQLPALAAMGFRVVAPDMRGYGESDKPAGTAAYRMDVLTTDIAELVKHLGEKKASVVGHDWGGAVAWSLPRYHPQLVERLVILNSPHPRAFRRELATSQQLFRSWYMFFFQLPVIPEMAIQLANFSPLERALTKLGGNLTPEELDQYRQAWKRPGALTAALNYYRAAFQLTAPRTPSRIETPTLLIWGEKDPALGVSLTEGLDKWVPNLKIEKLPNAGHWVHWDATATVNRLIGAFLSEGKAASKPPLRTRKRTRTRTPRAKPAPLVSGRRSAPRGRTGPKRRTRAPG